MNLDELDSVLESKNEADFVDINVYLGSPFVDDVNELEQENIGDYATVTLLQAEEKQTAATKRRIAEAEARIKDRDARIEEINAKAAEYLVVLRVTRMPGDEYAQLTTHYRADPESVADTGLGYNLDEVFRAALERSTSLVTADGPVHLGADRVQKILPRLAGSEVTALRSTVIALNDYGPRLEVVAAKKAQPSTATS